MCHAYRSRYSRSRGHSDPHGPRAADSLDWLRRPTVFCRQHRCRCTDLCDERPGQTIGRRPTGVTFVDAVLKRLRSCAVRVYVVIRTVVGILAKHRQREQDVPGRKPNVAERAGVMEDYILTSAKVVKG